MDKKFEGTINGRYLTDEEKDEFIRGWEEAGGQMEDMECPNPWCCPWYGGGNTTCEGNSPYEWGAAFWKECEPEYEALKAEEELYKEEEKEPWE